jgi:hypothetical protein
MIFVLNYGWTTLSMHDGLTTWMRVKKLYNNQSLSPLISTNDHILLPAVFTWERVTPASCYRHSSKELQQSPLHRRSLRRHRQRQRGERGDCISAGGAWAWHDLFSDPARHAAAGNLTRLYICMHGYALLPHLPHLPPMIIYMQVCV